MPKRAKSVAYLDPTFRERRKAAGILQTAVAERAGVSQATVHRMEGGAKSSQPTVAAVEAALADLLIGGVPAEFAVPDDAPPTLARPAFPAAYDLIQDGDGWRYGDTDAVPARDPLVDHWLRVTRSLGFLTPAGCLLGVGERSASYGSVGVLLDGEPGPGVRCLVGYPTRDGARFETTGDRVVEINATDVLREIVVTRPSDIMRKRA